MSSKVSIRRIWVQISCEEDHATRRWFQFRYRQYRLVLGLVVLKPRLACRFIYHQTPNQISHSLVLLVLLVLLVFLVIVLPPPLTRPLVEFVFILPLFIILLIRVPVIQFTSPRIIESKAHRWFGIEMVQGFRQCVNVVTQNRPRYCP